MKNKKIKVVNAEQSVMIYHAMLDSKIATFAALMNEVIKWGAEQGLTGSSMYHIQAAFTQPNGVIKKPNNE